MLSAIIGALFLFADQLIKFWTVSHLELNTGIRELFPGIVHLTYIKNYGAAFGLFSNAPWLRWVLLGLLVCFTLFILLGVRRGGYLRTGFARFTGIMLLAGLLGNGIDRAIYGYVVDMFELEFINFAIFNLADMLVVVFGILFCIALIAGGIGAPKKEEEYARRRSSRDDRQPQRVHRSHSDGQAHRSSRSGGGQSQRPRAEGEAQRTRRPRAEEEAPRDRQPRTEEEAPRTRRPRPEESGMSVRPLVSTQPFAETPVKAAVPAPETPDEDKVPEADATRPFQPVSQKTDAPEEPKAEPGATRPFQPVGQKAEAPEEPKAEPGATRHYEPVNVPAPAPETPKASGDTQPYVPAAKPAPAEPVNKTGDTQPYVPAVKPAPAAKPAAKPADEFDLDAILAEFK